MPYDAEQNRQGSHGNASEEVTEANAKHTTTEAVKAEEFAKTGGRAPEDPIAEILDEGQTMGHPSGQLRGDQTAGHRGGSRRQGQNRGRD